MAHVLAKLTGVKVSDIKQQFASDMNRHAEHGLYLKHLWQNADDNNEVFFYFQNN
jgi:hypothetical protein